MRQFAFKPISAYGPLLRRKARAIAANQSSLPDLAETMLHAMEQGETITKKASETHLITFKRQMMALGITPTLPEEEPYLVYEQARLTLDYVKALARVYTRIEQALAETKKQRRVRRATKRLIESKNLQPRIDERIATEQQRLETRTHQALDQRRQQATGITHYIWVTQGDSKVRSSHDARNGQIFSWENGGPYPGEEVNCRCVAVPTAISRAESKIEPIDEVEVAGLGIALRAAIQAMKSARTALAARTTAHRVQSLLRPKGKLIGKKRQQSQHS